MKIWNIIKIWIILFPLTVSHKNEKADTCTSESVYVCFQAQGRRPSSGCWPVGSDLTEEVSLSLRWSQIKPDAPTDPELCLSGEIPILNVSYKPQTISPKFKVSSRFLTADPWQDHPSVRFTAFSLLIDFSQQTEFTEIQGSESKKLKKSWSRLWPLFISWKTN